MENQFAELLSQVQALYPSYTVTMGLAQYNHQDHPQWWICVQSERGQCKCCGNAKSIVDKGSYNYDTFFAALEDIKSKLPPIGELNVQEGAP